MIFEVVDRKLTTLSVDCTYTWKEKCFLTKAKTVKKKKNCDFLRFSFLNNIERK